MPLIKCPMCEKDISPNAEFCPHCGEPMKKKLSGLYCLVLKDTGKMLSLKSRLKEVVGSTSEITDKLVYNTPSLILENLSKEKAEEYKSEFDGTDAKLEVVPKEECTLTMIYKPILSNRIVAEENQITCPTCKSKNVARISGASKAASVAMWGVFSGKIHKTFECKNCGYKW